MHEYFNSNPKLMISIEAFEIFQIRADDTSRNKFSKHSVGDWPISRILTFSGQVFTNVRFNPDFTYTTKCVLGKDKDTAGRQCNWHAFAFLFIALKMKQHSYGFRGRVTILAQLAKNLYFST